MRVRVTAVVSAAIALGGCATTTLKSYVGHDLQAMARRFGGPPTTHLRLPDGTDRFQWVVAFHRTPANSAPLTTFLPVNAAPLHARNAAAQAGAVFGGMCIYTVIARWDGPGAAWKMIGYQPPRIDCD